MTGNDKHNLHGKILDRKYKILEMLGEGGMGSVFKGEHLFLKRPCAIKLIHRVHSADPVALKRFKLEAEAASMLKHPNIIDIYDFGITDDELPYIVMEFLDGRSLDELLEAKRYFHYEEAISLMLQVCDALSHAHHKKVLHRDLKPANVILGKSENGEHQVKLVDFGVAKLLPGTGRSLEKLTLSGEVFGSPLYMSPEQCMGQSLDARSDIYAFGCVMYELLTGKLPLVGDSLFQVVMKHVNEMPPSFAEVAPDLAVPDELEKIVMRCMEKERALRFSDMSEVRKALTQIYTVRQFKELDNYKQTPSPLAAAAADDAETRKIEIQKHDTQSTGCDELKKKIAEIESKKGRFSIALIGPLSELFRLCKENLEFDEARSSKQRQLEIYRMHFGGASIDLAYCLDDIAEMSKKLKASSDAEEAYKESLKLKVQLLGAEDAETCLTRVKLADIYLKNDRLTEGEELIETALSAMHRSYGRLNIDCANLETEIADAYYDIDRREPAYSHYKEAAEISKELLGDLHIDLLSPLMNMARCRYFDRNYNEAISLCLNCVKICDANPSEFSMLFEHPWSLLAWSYYALKRFDESEDACMKSLEIYARCGELPTYASSTFSTLADICEDTGRADLAQAYRRRAKEIDPSL
ncbi:MAG: serine/threonine-protein kinase [Candidatus Obscuribacterales bacterium]|nr:serine/threonine-protein kinase [Candidatus Obscuribacterales bacterium]